MRKKIVAILLAATMAIGITACGNQSESNKEAKKDDNTITVWCWDKTFNIFAMEEAAKMLEFELAATLRDQIIELRGQ